MIAPTKEKKILLSLIASPQTKWKDEITKLSTLGINEIALFINSFSLEQRKEVYRLLSASNLKSIPYVHISNDFEEGEIDYLVTTYGTSILGLSLDNSSLAFIATMIKFTNLIAPENPDNSKFVSMFTDEALSRAGVSGVCLDVSTLEYSRLYSKKQYQLALHVLDHHPLKATQIGPVSENWFRKTFHLKSRYLKTLADLDYLKNVPQAYLADLLILDLENSLEEQLEVKRYLELMFK